MTAGQTELGAVALVTGAASGIGAATVDVLIGRGYRVIAVDRDPMFAGRDGVTGHVLDVGDTDGIRQLVSDIRGRLEVLVNAAAIRPTAGILEQDEASWRITLDVNLTGAFVTMQEAARRMTAGGSMVNVASAAANGKPGLGAYGASKAALISLTRTAALELAESGIRVNAVLPGTTATAMVTHARDVSGRDSHPRNVGGGLLAPEDVAEGIVRTALDPMLSGAVVPVGLLPPTW